jgi:hypothetical protein
MVIGSDSVGNAPGVLIKGTSQIIQEVVEGLDIVTEEEEKARQRFQSTLAGHIRDAYRLNKRARRESDIETEMTDSVYQVNMEYQGKELSAIESGSKIYMGLTATKSRAARSWIRDIIQPANEVPFRIDPTTSASLPQSITDQIEASFAEDSARLQEEIEQEFTEMSSPASPTSPQAEGEQTEGQPNPPQEQPSAPSALLAAKKLKRTSELRRDIEESIAGEIRKVAENDIRKIEKEVIDQLEEGGWSDALSDFIEDFTIYPTAFMKGPIVTTQVKLVWEGGRAVPKRQTVFKNQRVSPFDVYPSPSARTIYDGNFCEHLRLTKKELSDLTHLDADTGYKSESLIDILENIQPGIESNYMDNDIEEDKQDAEMRGSQTYASEGIYHGIHFWGTASVSMLKEWGYAEDDLSDYEDYEEVEIEAILVADRVVKCLINRDPLGRRPYYSASFQTRSGSIWGKSLPSLMRDIQRMCNACARALADNMGLSSGPQVALIIDRLADDGEIEEMAPRKIWQITSDPTGNSGKPIEFFTVPSNANELLAVYDKFEIKADDVTGVPRYAYGNENVGGAGQTASGLSMLLESASKGIKSSVKNISEGVISPRVEYQFYLHLLNEMENDNPINFTGDINVVVHAIDAITIKAAETQLQKELLQVVNQGPAMEIMGMEGYGDVLRRVFKGANLPEDAIPSRLVLKEKEAKRRFDQEKAQAAQQQQAQESTQVGLQATQLQVDGQREMHAGTQQTKMVEIQQKAHDKQIDQSLKATEIQQRAEAEANKSATKLQETQQKLVADGQNIDRKLAVDIAKTNKPSDIGTE